MAWRIEIDKDVQRSMKKLDKQIARRIVAKLHEISQLEDPRSMGKGLTENKSGLWRYRVGDYRIVADIEDDVLVILVVDVDHRSKVDTANETGRVFDPPRFYACHHGRPSYGRPSGSLSYSRGPVSSSSLARSGS